MKVEHAAIDAALDEINDRQFRVRLDALTGSCPTCGASRLHVALQSISDQGDEPTCAVCAGEQAQLAADLLRFWALLGSPREELEAIRQSPRLQASTQRLIGVVSKWALHYPLIMPTTVKWEVTNHCNLGCKHCLVDAGRKLENELSTEEALDLVDTCVNLGVQNLGILGGEPLMRPDLFAVMDYAISKKLAVTLTTNALLIDDATASRMASMGLHDLAVSIDGIGEVHDQFRGVKGAFRRTVRGLNNLAKHGVPFTIFTVVSKHNLHQLDEIIDLAVELGAAKFAINDLQPTGRGQLLRDMCLSQEEFNYLGQAMERKRAQHQNRPTRLLWSGVGKKRSTPDIDRGPLLLSTCGAALTELTVGADGGIRACPFLPPTTENLRQRPLEEIWFDSTELDLYRDRGDLKGQCGVCQLKYVCGGCRARAEAFLGDPLGPDIRCQLDYAFAPQAAAYQ
ncbi:MAG: radical SAM protein [Caldilineaceae bacterium]|nr:radical SAM protein [Caldilineaceae bacterium]MBP8108388.1 radical SAM protein [Caldilineaceae bacterium]MBP8123313.1 radical SAM protein [Caldilineaceae bacterium]MBP9073545.1 radical SAM protein [Caldilineaceae bacterium]